MTTITYESEPSTTKFVIVLWMEKLQEGDGRKINIGSVAENPVVY